MTELTAAPTAGGYDWKLAKTGKSWLATPADLLNPDGKSITLQVLCGARNYAGRWIAAKGMTSGWLNAPTPQLAAQLAVNAARQRFAPPTAPAAPDTPAPAPAPVRAEPVVDDVVAMMQLAGIPDTQIRRLCQ